MSDQTMLEGMLDDSIALETRGERVLIAELRRLKGSYETCHASRLHAEKALDRVERERDEARAKIEAALAIKPACKLSDCPCQRGMREALTGGA